MKENDNQLLTIEEINKIVDEHKKEFDKIEFNTTADELDYCLNEFRGLESAVSFMTKQKFNNRTIQLAQIKRDFYSNHIATMINNLNGYIQEDNEAFYNWTHKEKSFNYNRVYNLILEILKKITSDNQKLDEIEKILKDNPKDTRRIGERKKIFDNGYSTYYKVLNYMYLKDLKKEDHIYLEDEE